MPIKAAASLGFDWHFFFCVGELREKRRVRKVVRAACFDSLGVGGDVAQFTELGAAAQLRECRAAQSDSHAHNES